MTDEKKHAEDIEEVLQKFVARCKYGISSSDISLVAKEIVAKTDEVMPTITDEEIEAHFTTPHYHYEKGHYYKIRKDRIFGAKWMRDEIRKRMGKKFDGNKSVDETMPTGPRFLSPSPLEREWQEHCLKMMFPDYPNVCSWQVLNSLIITSQKGTELGVPEYDEWLRNRRNSSEKPNNSEGGREETIWQELQRFIDSIRDEIKTTDPDRISIDFWLFKIERRIKMLKDVIEDEKGGKNKRNKKRT